METSLSTWLQMLMALELARVRVKAQLLKKFYCGKTYPLPFLSVQLGGTTYIHTVVQPSHRPSS